MHMGDILLSVVEHSNAEIVGICDNDWGRMNGAIQRFNIRPDQVFTDISDCLNQTQPDLAILCPATADHAVEVARVAKHGVDILIEKRFAANLTDADHIIDCVRAFGISLAVNWPLRWYPPHVTTKRLIDEGAIGDVVEVHFYGGNRGPLYHLAEKIEVSDEEVRQTKPTSWWYKTASGGGSLLDYLGYGATLGTWFMNGRVPLTVTTILSSSTGIEVDEHSITVCRYDTGLSKFETRWGTLTDPWTSQAQPKCGFVVVGTAGTISSYDFESHVGLQTQQEPDIKYVSVEKLDYPNRNPVEYVLHCKERGKAVDGPLDPGLCRISQRIIDTAVKSAKQQKTLDLIP